METTNSCSPNVLKRVKKTNKTKTYPNTRGGFYWMTKINE